MTRILKTILLVGLAGVALAGAGKSSRPNVLFISVDDLNDWIEPLGGHPQAKTPNFNRLAAQSLTFTRNYCPLPGCNPSRSADHDRSAPLDHRDVWGL